MKCFFFFSFYVYYIRREEGKYVCTVLQLFHVNTKLKDIDL